MNRKTTERLKIPEAVRVPLLGGILYRRLTALDNRLILAEQIPQPALNTQPRKTKVIASMTSFPARIAYAHVALKSLLLQSYRPDRLILWLANEQFPDHRLPDELLALQAYGLEIRWCDDLYGHKKYYYCLKEQTPDEVVITFDDDIIYPVDAIRRLVETHKRYPHCLVCERAQSIAYESDGTLKNPGTWPPVSDVGWKTPSYSLNPSPGGGCLIPYGGFYKDAQDEEKIRSLAYKNDDLWYMFMAAENGTRTIKTQKYHKPFSLVAGSQGTQMATENVLGDRNREIMKGLIAAYPTAYRRILRDED